MTDNQPSSTKQARLQELLAAIKANIPVAGGWGRCSTEPSFVGHWEVADRDCAERVKRAAAELKQSIAGSLQEHGSAREILVQELLAAIEANKPIATGSGRCPYVPCFDCHDSEAESNRPGWELVERDRADRIRKAAAAIVQG